MGILRLRMGTDGPGIRTLVAFHECPLSCEFCLNPQCHYCSRSQTWWDDEDVAYEIKKDELYYLSTSGGVTFGGGEPLLWAEFIRKVLEKFPCHAALETSLNVEREKLEILLPFIQEYIVDIKDMDPCIYEQYTGKDNTQVLDNLRFLIENGKADLITCRIPLIPGFNTSMDQERSKQELEKMGISRFDLFKYYIRTNR